MKYYYISIYCIIELFFLGGGCYLIVFQSILTSKQNSDIYICNILFRLNNILSLKIYFSALEAHLISLKGSSKPLRPVLDSQGKSETFPTAFWILWFLLRNLQWPFQTEIKERRSIARILSVFCFFVRLLFCFFIAQARLLQAW